MWITVLQYTIKQNKKLSLRNKTPTKYLIESNKVSTINRSLVVCIDISSLQTTITNEIPGFTLQVFVGYSSFIIRINPLLSL